MPEACDLLYIPWMSESIYCRPWLNYLNGKTILACLIEWHNAISNKRLYVVAHAGEELNHILECYPECGVRIVNSVRKVNALRDAVEHLDVEHMALLPLTSFVGPDILLSHSWDHHMRCGNDYTKVNFCEGVSPLILSKRLLQLLSVGSVPGSNVGIIDIIRAFLQMQVAAPDSFPFYIKASLFDAAAVYRCDPVDLPDRVNCECAEDIEILAAAVTHWDSEIKNDEWRKVLKKIRKVKYERDRSLYEVTLPTAVRARRLEKSHVSGPARILYVSDSAAYSGGAASLCSSIACLDNRRFSPTALISACGWFSEELQRAGVDVHVVGRSVYQPTFANTMLLSKLIEQIKPEIIHVNEWCTSSLLSAAWKYGCPVIQHVRLATLERMEDTLCSADAIIAVSDFVKYTVLRTNVDPERIYTIYNGIDVDRYTPNPEERRRARHELGIDENTFVILMVSRFSPDKRHDVFIQAVAKVNRVRPVIGIIIGEHFEFPDLAAQAQSLVSDLGLCENIRFMGFEKDIRRIELVADVQVLLAENDALSRSILEGMALETPIIISDSGGLPELIRDTGAGNIVPIGDSDTVAEALLKLLDDAELRREMGKIGRRIILDRANVKVNITQMMEVYDKVYRR